MDDEGEPAAGTSRGAKVRGLRREMRRFLSGRRMVSRTPASEVAFLQGLDQAKWGKSLPVEAAPVDLARQVRAVSQAGHDAPFRRQRKPRAVGRLTDVIGKPHP